MALGVTRGGFGVGWPSWSCKGLQVVSVSRHWDLGPPAKLFHPCPAAIHLALPVFNPKLCSYLGNVLRYVK